MDSEERWEEVRRGEERWEEEKIWVETKAMEWESGIEEEMKKEESKIKTEMWGDQRIEEEKSWSEIDMHMRLSMNNTW